MTRDATTWSRLEPRPRNAEMVEGLRASIRDPLWLLSRQWQFGEFRGEDAGSPVAVDLTVEQDDLTRVDLRGAENDTAPIDYEDAPLEALVERERIATPGDGNAADVADRAAAEPPDRRLAAEAGQQFLRALEENGYTDGGSAYAAEAFPADLRLAEPDEPVGSEDRRYLQVVAGRTLDGAAVYRAIQEGVGNVDAVVDPDDPADTWSAVTASALPLPTGGSRTAAFEAGVEEYYRWYRDLYDEPTDAAGTAWDPTRMEYRFAVSTGAGSDETVLEAEEYPGGTLDWHAFSPADGSESLGATGEATSTVDRRLLPTSVSFPGMPAPRWWEFEDAAVSLDDVAADGLATPRLLVLEFATQYGNDWYQIPVETGVGMLSRVTDLSVTDSFGLTETAQAATEADDPSDPPWRLFSMELPNHGEPGLFVPPTLPSSRDSESVERVRLLRDEMANLAFGIEERIEGATGRPVDRSEFTRPHLVVETVAPADDPDGEYVDVANAGDDALDADGVLVRSEDGTVVHTFVGRTIDSGESVRVYTGVAPTDEPEAIGADLSTPVWSDADAVVVADGADVLAKRLSSRAPETLADYRLSTDVPDHWFPFTMEVDPASGAHRLLRSLLLDADTLGLDVDALPRPVGELLDPDDAELPSGEDHLRIFEEEVTKSGLEVVRRYQLANWSDGSTFLWSARRTRVGRSDESSGLRFDVVEEPDGG